MREIAEPTILKAAKDALSDIKVAATVTWHPLINNFIDHQDPTTLDAKHLANSDEEATVQAEQWIKSGNYDFIFVDMDECDGAGHSYGFDGYANEYSQAVMEMDQRVGRLLDAVEQNSQNVEYLIVLTTDHGGEGTSHSGFNPYNRRIPFFVASNSNRVAIGTMPPEDTGSQMDVFPTILHFLNAPIPGDLEGQVFGFTDYVRATPPTPAPCVPDPSTCSCLDDQSDYRGTIAETKTGKTCMGWDEQDPHSHTRTPSDYPNAGLENNYCRNPDGEAGAWCYTTDPASRWELCDIPQCGTGSTSSPTTTLSSPPTPTPPEPTPTPPTVNPPACASLADQSDYRGTIAETKTGKTCMGWDEQDPHSHDRTPSNYPNSGLENNYCRNPDGEAGAWCYTTDPSSRWELCDIPQCGTSPPTPTPTSTPPESTPKPSIISSPDCSCLDDQSDYRGDIQKTEKGKTCMRWDEQDPHRHTRTPSNYPNAGLENNNFCRNPDGEPRAWCYTTDPGSRWEFCNVPRCVTCNNSVRSLRG